MYGMKISGSVKIGDNYIKTRKSNKYIIYNRYKNNELVIEQILNPDIELYLMPIYPLYYPKYITQYILCNIEPRITISPRSTLDFYIKIPVDIAVYAYYDNSFKIIDIIPTNDIYKMVLYGPIQSGVITRYCRSRIYENLSDVGERKYYAISYIKIINQDRYIRTISKILFDSSPLRLYYKLGTWEVYTQEIEINIISRTMASLIYGAPFLSGLIQLDDPPQLKPPRLINKTDMIWGY